MKTFMNLATLLVLVSSRHGASAFNSFPATAQKHEHASLSSEHLNTSDNCRRRAIMKVVMSSMALMVPKHRVQAAVIQVDPCVLGEGSGCEDRDGSNDFVRELQRKSAERQEEYKKEALNAYNMKNYPDYFKTLNPPRTLVQKRSDGSFLALTDDEINTLRRSNKIGTSMAKTMGGRVTDLTQKPVLQFLD